MKGRKSKEILYLKPDPFQRYIGPKNWSKVLIDGELTTCLLDNGSQLNFMTPTYAIKRGLNVMSLNHLAEESGEALPPINCLRGRFVKPTGFMIVNVQIPCVKGYNEDQIVIVMDNPNMKECPVLLGTPTIYHVMPVIKESEINQLATPWATSQLSWMFCSVTAAVATPLTDVANKTLSPTELNEGHEDQQQSTSTSLWAQDHPLENWPHPARVQDERHDTWLGEEITSATTRY